MSITELLFLSFALASDALAISISKGLSSSSHASTFKTALACGLWFGAFQALMPLISFSFGFIISKEAEQLAPFIASFFLLCLGIKTLKETHGKKQYGQEYASTLSVRTMFALALATSIDALAVGFTFAALGVNILFSVAVIAVVTFTVCFIGSALGAKIGSGHEKKASFIGGIILIIIAVKIFVEHLTSL